MRIYKLLIMQPSFVTEELVKNARELAAEKKANPRIADVRLESFEEGKAVQMLHIGPYSTEMETYAQMDAYVTAEGWEMYGLHHEVYLGDPRKSNPATLKTILRHPVCRKQN